MGYPKTLYKYVNSIEEESDALAFGCYIPGASTEEFPKMLYKHPEDKSKEHTFVVVANQEEAQSAFDNGFQEKPHVPVNGDEPAAIVQGSGSERYEAGDWTQSNGEGLTDETTLIPKKQESPKDVLDREGVNEKPNGEKIED